eukprot:XP_001707848.1 Hypothetical protein GL50803_35119 [Giardia lamblia ATCC 50803]
MCAVKDAGDSMRQLAHHELVFLELSGAGLPVKGGCSEG